MSLFLCCGWCFSGIDTTFKASRLFVGLFRCDFRLYDFRLLAISCAQNRGLIKKEQKSGQKLRYFTNIQILPSGNARNSQKSGREPAPGRRSVWRSCGVRCVARQAVNFRRFLRWRYPYKGKQKNGSTGFVARSERVRYPERIPCGDPCPLWCVVGLSETQKAPRRIRRA